MVFADSSGYVAVFDPRDAGHAAANAAWQEVAKARLKMVTTALVVAETATLVRRRVGWEASRKVGDAILRSRGIDVVGIDGEGLSAAWREFLRNPDRKLSLCDAYSFVVMRERGIRRAFTFDRHFADAGFDPLPWG